MPHSVNQYSKFRRLVDNSHTEIITISSVNGDGTSTGTTPSGDTVKVRGESVLVNDKAFVKDNLIVGKAPNLTISEILV